MTEIERLAKVLFESEPCHKDCAREVLDGAWASTDCDFKTSRVESVRAVLQAMRDEPPSLPTPEAFDVWTEALDGLLAPRADGERG